MTDPVFVTGNMDKVRWVEKFLGRKLEHHKLDLDEIQDLDPARVLEHKAREAFRILQKPVLVEDTCMWFIVLGRLPGTFIKFFLQEIGNEGMCRLLDGYNDRSAKACVTFGYFDGSDFRSFQGLLEGYISDMPRGARGHGWDPIFVPFGQGKTFGEMTEVEYTSYSARKKAAQKLAEFLNG